MTTLAALFALDASPEYTTRRAAKVTEIAEYLRDLLAAPDDADWLAEQAMADAEEHGTIDDNAISSEIRSSHTKTGNPLPFEI